MLSYKLKNCLACTLYCIIFFYLRICRYLQKYRRGRVSEDRGSKHSPFPTKWPRKCGLGHVFAAPNGCRSLFSVGSFYPTIFAVLALDSLISLLIFSTEMDSSKSKFNQFPFVVISLICSDLQLTIVIIMDFDII